MSETDPRPWSGPEPSNPVLLGVEPGQDPRIVERAARLAADLGTGLLCAWVDPTRFLVHQPGSALLTAPMDPDEADAENGSRVADEIHEHLTDLLVHSNLVWRLVSSAGDTARSLELLARKFDAPYIVVGTRRPGVTGWMSEAFEGSIAAQLAHTQTRPVVVVPCSGRREEG